MPTLDIVLNTELNTSVAVGDMVYAVTPTSTGSQADSFLSGNFSRIVEVGEITAITNIGITIVQTVVYTPPTGAFLMFSKDKVANTSGLLGYYMQARFKNNSKIHTELFSVGAEVILSSK